MSDTATAMSDVAPVKAEDTPVVTDAASSTAVSSSSSSAAAAPAIAARKFPAEYYLVPSSTTNSNMPSYTQEEMDSFAALPPDSIGYVQVKRHFLVNPRSGAAASVAPAPRGTDAKPEQPNANKAAKVSGQSSAPEAVTRNESDGAAASKCDEAGECRSAEAAAATEGDGEKEGNDKDSRKRKRGQNKNSEREMYKSSEAGEVRLCKATAAGLECKWKDSCRYSHDVTAFIASRAAPIPEVCPVWKKYGTCAAGLMCRFAGHAESDKPADPPVEPYNTPIGNELNIPSQQLLQNMRSCGLKGKQYEATFPKSIALMKLHDAWKVKYDKLREKRQADKERAQREQNKAQAAAEKKAAFDKKIAAAIAAAKAVTESQTAPADSSMTDVVSTTATAAASEFAAAPAPAADASTSSSTTVETAAPAAPAPATSSSSTPAASSATPAPAANAAAITSTILPPTFPVHTLEEEIEIAAMKAQYTPPFPKKVDPFQIVPAATEKYCDWSSGMILIDIERKAFEFKDKLVLAPLTTVGNLPFRLVAREFGADVTIGEMALVSSINRGMVGEWALLRRHKSEKYFGVQIAGAFPDQIARACEHINTQCQVDFVDYNIGCPIDPVTSKGMGSSLMQRKRIKNVEPICRTLTSMLDCPATIKMRMGWSATEITAMELLPVVKRAGMAAVTIHGRTRQQRYTKAANWEFIHEAANFCHDKLDNLPVIANGDVYTFEDYEGLINPNSNITTTMIARGALIKPWIFTEIRERRHWDISATERLDMLKSFVSYAFEHFGTDTKGLENTRRYLLEWLSFLCRYVPIGLLEIPRVQMQLKSPYYYARSDLEQLLCSTDCKDWIRISEILIGPTPDNFRFIPKHKSSATDESGSQNVEG